MCPSAQAAAIDVSRIDDMIALFISVSWTDLPVFHGMFIYCMCFEKIGKFVVRT